MWRKTECCTQAKVSEVRNDMNKLWNRVHNVVPPRPFTNDVTGLAANQARFHPGITNGECPRDDIDTRIASLAFNVEMASHDLSEARLQELENVYWPLYWEAQGTEGEPCKCNTCRGL